MSAYWFCSVLFCFLQTNGVQLILYTFFGPETRYVGRATEAAGTGFRKEYLNFRRIDPNPLKLWEFIQPLALGARVTVLIPAVAYSMIFLFGSVLCTVEIPQLLQRKFGLDTQGLGLQFLSLIIGSVLGEQIGGPLSDLWMNRRSRKLGHRAAPEHRLWLSYSGYVLTMVGIIVFLVQTQNAPGGSWNVTPIVGVAIAAFGNQIVTTVLITYAVDTNHDQAASVGVFITFVRQMWGFIGPFWYVFLFLLLSPIPPPLLFFFFFLFFFFLSTFTVQPLLSINARFIDLTKFFLLKFRFPDMFTNVGIAKSAGVAVALMVGCSLLPTLWLQLVARKSEKKDDLSNV